MIGTTLGAYRLEEAIGRGGMGVVYRATDTRLGRTVAIKVLPPATDDHPRSEEQARRFLKEAQAASALSHPNIVTLHDLGRDGDVDFIVMEYVAGRTLADLIASGSLPVSRVVDIARQISDALAAAHAAGIVHRDLKPHNVIVGEDGRARVLDFGLARIEVGDDSATLTMSAGITEPGTILGTPAYMAPEQVEGRVADARSDIHALGVVLYEMLTGARPFRASSYVSTVHAIVYEDPEPVADLRPDAPRPLVRVIERCMRKNPTERYANGAELRAALEPIGHALETGSRDAGDSVSARVADAAGDARRALGRRWGLRTAILAAIAAVIVVIAWFASPGLQRFVGERFGAILPAAEATPYALYKAGLDDLAHYFEPGRLDRAIENFQKAVAADPEYAPGYVGLSQAYWRRYRENRDFVLLQQSLGIARRAREVDPQLARAHVAYGLALIESKSFDEAQEALDTALRLDPLNAQARRGLGAIHQAQGRPEEAEFEYSRAISLAPGDWEIRSQRALLFFLSGRYEDALADFQESALLSPDNHLTYRNIGGTQHMLGRYADAAASFQRSIEIHPDPAVYSNLGTIYFFQGLYPQAVGALEKSVELGPNNATIWRNLGDAYRQVPDREADAAQAYARAAQLLREELERHPEDPVLTADLALCLARRGETDEARRLSDGIDQGGRALPEVSYSLVLIYEALGDRSAALAALEAAIAAGHPIDEIKEDPELVDLRKDSAYHRLLTTSPGKDQ